MYVVAAVSRAVFMGRDWPIAHLALWVYGTDTLRFLLLRQFPAHPWLLVPLDVLWLSWYVAHHWAASRYGGRPAPVSWAVTLLLAAVMGGHYLAVERWMGPLSMRDIWLQVVGVFWSVLAFLGFWRAKPGIGMAAGCTSSALSAMQVGLGYSAIPPYVHRIVGTC